MPVETAPIVGIPSKTTWSSTATFRFESGEMWCAAGFSGDESAPHDGRKFIAFLEELGPADGADLYQKVSAYWQNWSAQTAYSVAIGFLQADNRMLVMTFGFAGVGFVKQDQPRWLLDGAQEQGVLEGEMNAGERFVLMTARAVSLPHVLDTAARVPPGEVAAELLPVVQSHQHSGEVALFVIEHKARVGTSSATSSVAADPTTASRASSRVAHAPDSSDDSLLEQVEAPTAADHSDDDVTPDSPKRGEMGEKHLISPDKIRAGISAANDDETTKAQQRIRRQLKFSLPDWKQLHLLRVGFAVVVVIALLSGLVLYRSWNIQREYEQVVVPLEGLTQEVLAYPEEDRFEQRSAAESLLERLRATKTSYQSNRNQVATLLSQVEGVFNEVSGQQEIVNLPVFYDFRLVAANFLATKAVRQRDQAYFLDTQQGRLIRLDLNSKQNETVVLDEPPGLIDFTWIGNLLYFLTQDGLWRSSLTGSDFEQVSPLEDLGESISIGQFGSNAYILDRGEQQIWRYDTEAENASPSGWVRSAQGVDFAQLTSMAINGSIWLGSSDGDIYELARGERESFSFVGLPNPFVNSLIIAANEEGERLAVVEPMQQRVVIFNKETGEYLQQITSEQIGAVTDAFLSNDEDALYMLAGSVVYRVEI